MITKIEVTEYEIALGCRQNPRYCPVALALNKILDQDKYIALLTQSKAHIYELPRNIKDEFKYEIYLPEEVYKFIMGFDLKNDSKPFSFELDIPQEFLK